ncbi:hypothetical protein JYB64_03005 [Algoriphagus aestuarii]|nr:hypothetical protein [Algoriphagus aestuarii]
MPYLTIDSLKGLGFFTLEIIVNQLVKVVFTFFLLNKVISLELEKTGLFLFVPEQKL